MKIANSNKLKLLLFTIISLNLLSILILLYVCITGYFIEYPRLTFNTLGATTYVVLFIVFLIPSVFSSIQLTRISKNRAPQKRIAHFLLIGVSLVLSIISGFILASVPPVESYTAEIKNYLLLDQDLNSYSRSLKKFFPEKIPLNAKNIAYSYRKYSDLFKTDAIISASWTVPEESYTEYRQEMLKQSKLKEIEPNKYEVVLVGIEQLESLQLFIEYNDVEYSITYIAIIQPH